MLPALLIMSLSSMLAAEVVVLPLNNSAWGLAVIAGDEPQGIAVITSEDDPCLNDRVVIFSDQATRVGGKPHAAFKPRPGIDLANILALEDGTLATMDFNGNDVDIYDPQAVMSGAAAHVQSLKRVGFDSSRVMTQLSDGRLLVGASIFAKEALTQGGSPSTQLNIFDGWFNGVTSFQGGVIYTDSHDDEHALLLFDDAAVASNSTWPGAEAALFWGDCGVDVVGGCGPKWNIPTDICTGPTHVFADGAIAVLGNCDPDYVRTNASASLHLLENIDLEAQTLKNQSFAMMMGKPQAVLALPSGLVAVGVTTDPCREGHVEIFEESVLRSGGEAALIVNTSGSVNSMAVLQDGRLAVATSVGGCLVECRGSISGTVDIIDVTAEMRQSSSIFV